MGNEPLRFSECRGDGSCQFNAMSYIIHGDETRATNLRNNCVDYVLINKDHYRHYITNVEAWAEKMRRPGEWGDHYTLDAFGKLYNFTVIVMGIRSGVFTLQGSLGMGRYAYMFYPGNHYDTIEPRNVALTLKPTPEFYTIRNNREHAPLAEFI